MKKFLLSLIIAMNFVGIHATAIKHDKIAIPPTMEIANDSLFNRSCYPVFRYLQLDEIQQQMFQKIHLDLYKSIKYLDENKELAKNDFNKHLKRDLRISTRILSEEQYKKYIRVLNVTLNNKGLIQYTWED